MAIEVRPLSAHIGAEVLGLDLSKPVAPNTRAELYGLWLRYLVLLFRDQALTQEDLLHATECFGSVGQLSRPKEFRPKGFDNLLNGIMLISNVRENGVPIGALPDGEMHFHHDMLHSKKPHKGTLLYSVEVPTVGGNTLFANGYVAYERLSSEIKAKIEGRRSVNRYNYGSVQRDDRKGVAAFAESMHPVFRTHEETGRKAIYVNRLMTIGIDGIPHEEAEQLLSRVFQHSENKDYVYEHVWRPRDLLVWDNRCSMHARTDFSAGERRLMLRTTIEGNVEPF